jgi:hypothetical protein
MFFNNADTGYAVGANGTILKTSTGGIWTGISEKPLAGNLKITPNPAKEKITIDFPEQSSNMNGKVTVCSAAGLEVIRQQVQGSAIQLNVGSLPAGIYFVAMMKQGKTEYGKFIKY